MYNKKSLSFEFQNYTNAFDDKGNTKITIAECKAIAKVSFSGNIGGFQAEVTLFGLGLELIAALSSKGIGQYTLSAETIGMKIYASDTLIFDGHINSSYANMNAVPDASLVISGVAGLDLAHAKATPFSQQGSAPYKDILSAICKANGYTFTSSGIDGIVGSNPYFTGSPLDQIKFACQEANLQFAVNGKSVSVWRNGYAVDDVIPLVSKEFGLIGYPVFTPGGITFQAQFSTYLSQGRYVKLETDLPHATGTYGIFAVDHYLSSWVKDGPWLSVAQGYKIQNGEQQQQQQ